MSNTDHRVGEEYILSSKIYYLMKRYICDIQSALLTKVQMFFARGYTVDSSTYLGILIVLLIMGCEPRIAFYNPNPPAIEGIDKIPEYFQGMYLCESDSSIVRIEDYAVYHESHYLFVTELDKVKESEYCSIVDGGLHLPDRAGCFPFDYISEDSIAAHIYYLDTIFSFQSGEAAKYYKGQLFLNTRNRTNNWTTWIVRPYEHGHLELLQLDIPVDEETISDLSDNYTVREIKKDKQQYVVRPTLVEFEQILNKEYFKLCEVLIPINIERYYPDKSYEL